MEKILKKMIEKMEIHSNVIGNKVVDNVLGVLEFNYVLCTNKMSVRRFKYDFYGKLQVCHENICRDNNAYKFIIFSIINFFSGKMCNENFCQWYERIGKRYLINFSDEELKSDFKEMYVKSLHFQY